MGKLALWVTCKSCGRPFDTGMRLDRKSFDRGTLAANYHLCPHCGQRQTYRKSDYLASDDASVRPGNAESRDRGNASGHL